MCEPLTDGREVSGDSAGVPLHLSPGEALVGSGRQLLGGALLVVRFSRAGTRSSRAEWLTTGEPGP